MANGTADAANDSPDQAQAQGVYLISPVQRALRLLDFVANGGVTTQLSRLAKQLDINRVTLARLLDTLEYERMIEPVPGGAGHRVGARFLAMAAAALGDRDLLRLARPILAKLAAETQFSAHLAVMSGNEMVYLLQELPNTLLVSNIRVGSRVPAHFTAPGRILLAGVPARTRRSLLGRGPLASATERTPTTHAELDRMIAQDQARGCAWSHSGFEQGVDACAAAVRDGAGQVIAAISVVGPESRFDAQTSIGVESAVIGAARALSQMFGHRPES